jgi:hypothetical protein
VLSGYITTLKNKQKLDVSSEGQCDQTFSAVITKRAEILPNWIFFYQTHFFTVKLGTVYPSGINERFSYI